MQERSRKCRKTTKILALLTLVTATGFAGYVVEWSASLSYSMATSYTSNKAYSYDITGDSIPEVFVMDSSALKVFSGVTHNLIWSIPLSYPYGGYPIICNTDGDANKEIVFSAYGYSSGYSGRFYVYDCQSHAQDYISPVKNGYPSVAVADVDGDGKSEICCVSGNAGSRILEVYGSDAVGQSENPPVPHSAFPALQFFAAPNPARHLVQLNVPPLTTSGVLTISDATGRVVRTISVPANPGNSALVPLIWDCCDDADQPVPAGPCFFRCGGSAGKVDVCY